MKSQDQRINELEQLVSQLARELARVAARQAVLLSPRNATWIGEANGAIDFEDSGDVTVWTGTPGSEVETDLVISNCYNRTADILAGQWVVVQFVNGYKYVAPLGCE